VARPRTPTEILEVRGAFRKDPQRKREVGPKAQLGLGEPPGGLTEAEAATWREVVGNAPAGVLTSAERILVEIVARLLARMRADWLTGAELAQLTQSLARLGWTPADRSRVQAAKADEPEDPFAEFRSH